MAAAFREGPLLTSGFGPRVHVPSFVGYLVVKMYRRVRPGAGLGAMKRRLKVLLGLAVIGQAAAAQPPQPVAEEIDVNTITAGIQDFQQLAVLDDGTFVAVWESDASGDDDILLRRFTADGLPAGGSEVVVNETTAGDQQDPHVAALGTGAFVVVWDSGNGGNREILGRVFGSDGTALGGEFPISDDATHDHNDAVVAALGGGDFVVVWEREGPSTTSEDLVAREFLTARGPSVLIDVNQTTTGDQEDAAIAAASDGTYVVAWESGDDIDDDIWARRFEPGVGALGDEFAVSTEGAGLQANCDVAMHPDGRFAIVHEDQASNPWSISARFYDAAGVAVGAPFTVNTANRPVLAPRIALDSIGRGIVVWDRWQVDLTSDIIANAVLPDGTLDGTEFVVNEVAGEDELVPAIALGPSGGLWVWLRQCSEVEGCEIDLEGRPFALPIFADGFESGDIDAW